MDTLQLLGSAAGLGFLSGFRLYATVFALGMAARLGWLSSAAGETRFGAFADTRILVIAGAACLVEFLADKIPWVDSAWDSIHTFIRPVGAILLTAGVFAVDNHAEQLALMLLSGGVAFTGHASKAATRFAVNHSPEPFSNLGLSILEDVLVAGGLWVVVAHPVVAFVAVTAFVAIFAWASPKVFRAVRVQVAAISAVLRRALSGGHLEPRWVGEVPPDFRFLIPYMEPLPPHHAEMARRHLSYDEVPLAVRAVATRSIRKSRNSIGYLFFAERELVFVTRRAFRYRRHTIELEKIEAASLQRGILLDSLTVKTADLEYRFDLFKVA